ncbi:hypothetical protein LTS08_007324 [Lithohypha guttulata]|nr:hypothetical protein LTS08_007324 [Lithohypha guttulata]
MRVENKDLSGFFAYTYGTAAWLGLQSATLILTPKLVVNLLAVDESHHTSDIEVYFARSLGFALTILAIIVLFFTGTVPISTSVSQPISLEENDSRAPYAMPVIQATTLFHLLSTIYCYTRYLNSGQTGYILGLIGYGGLACAGAWSVLFGFTSRVSARTGEDKRTSGFLFPNTAAYDKKADRKLK